MSIGAPERYLDSIDIAVHFVPPRLGYENALVGDLERSMEQRNEVRRSPF